MLSPCAVFWVYSNSQAAWMFDNAKYMHKNNLIFMPGSDYTNSARFQHDFAVADNLAASWAIMNVGTLDRADTVWHG